MKHKQNVTQQLLILSLVFAVTHWEYGDQIPLHSPLTRMECVVFGFSFWMQRDLALVLSQRTHVCSFSSLDSSSIALRCSTTNESGTKRALLASIDHFTFQTNKTQISHLPKYFRISKKQKIRKIAFVSKSHTAIESTVGGVSESCKLTRAMGGCDTTRMTSSNP